MDRLSKNELLVILDQQLQNAQNIQKKIIPKPQMFHSDFYHLYTYLKPFRRVGGDFYDFHIFDDDQVSLVLTDTTGHGLDAAMLTTMVKLSYTYALKNEETKNSPAAFIKQLDHDISSIIESSFFSSIIFRLDPHEGKLYYSNAGHPAGLLLHDGKIDQLSPTLPLVGMHGLMSFLEYKDEERPFQNGDKMIVFTDGLVEAVNTAGEPLGSERVSEILVNHQDEPIPDICGHIINYYKHFTKNTVAEDDLCLIGVEYDDRRNIET